MKPKVSIIVPCWNVEKYLNRCVDSLIHQTLKDIEIILVDDESPDSVPQMCDEWASKDQRIKVIHKKNAGLGMACNSGIEVATGSYIAFCDSDDYVDRECYESMYDEAIKSNSDAVFCGIKRINQNGVILPMFHVEKPQLYSKDKINDFIFGMIASDINDPTERSRPMSAKIAIYSGDIVRTNKIRFHSERQYISEDLLFNIDFLIHSKQILESTNTFYYYYVNTSSLSQIYREDRFEKYLILRKYLLDTYDFGKRNHTFCQRVDKMVIGYTRSAMRKIVNSNKSYREKQKCLKIICRDNIWSEISNEFPVKDLPLIKRIVFLLTKYKLSFLLFWVFRFMGK